MKIRQNHIVLGRTKLCRQGVFMTFAPPPAAPTPPPPPAEGPAVQLPLFLWAFPATGVLGLIGALLPWFKPTFDGKTFPGEPSVHSWNDGRIGLAGPVLLVVVGVLSTMLLFGRMPARFTRSGSHPLRGLAKYGLIAGAVTVVTSAIAYGIVPENFKDWKEAEAAAKAAGVTMGRGPMLGYWLVLVAGLIAVALGAALFFQSKDVAVPPAFSGGYVPPAVGDQAAFQQPAGYAPPPAGYAPPPPSPEA
jgi:hypothetical protein